MIGQTYSHQYDMLTVATFPTVTVGNVANICPHCEGNHIGDRCPYIKAIEYDDAGKVRRIELYPRPVKLPPPVVTMSGGFSSDNTTGLATWNPNTLRTYGLG